MSMVYLQVGEGEDAAVRQQERVPDHRRHGRRHALEHTARVAREIAAAVRDEPEVTDYQVYVGTAAPYNFNGLVRHYFLRRGPNVADIQVNLVGKDERHAQSHDIAKRVRPRVQADRGEVRRAREGGRGAAGTAGAANAGGGDLRPDYQQQIADGPQGARHLQATPTAWWTWTGTSRPTSRRSCSSSTTKRRAQRHQRRADCADAADRRWKDRRSGCCTRRGRRRTSAIVVRLPVDAALERERSAGAARHVAQRALWCRWANWSKRSATTDRQEHLPQEPHAGRLRHRRRGRRGGKPGVRDSAR